MRRLIDDYFASVQTILAQKLLRVITVEFCAAENDAFVHFVLFDRLQMAARDLMTITCSRRTRMRYASLRTLIPSESVSACELPGRIPS